MQKNYMLLLLCAFATALMVVLSLMPWAAPPQIYYIDKILHFSAFFAITTPLLLAVRGIRSSMCVMLVMLLIGGGIELLQNDIEMRSGSWEDFFADIGGIVLAFLGVQLYHRRKNTRKS